MSEFFNSVKELLIKLLDYSIVNKIILSVFLIYILFINIKTYVLFVQDKKYAVEDAERISEARLLKHCFFGGALGGFLGMRIAHHKTKKFLFSVCVPLMLIIQALAVSFVCGFFGFWIYMS